MKMALEISFNISMQIFLLHKIHEKKVKTFHSTSTCNIDSDANDMQWSINKFAYK
jgi:hypothetical protein